MKISNTKRVGAKGTYYFQRRVPDDVRNRLGVSRWERSLRTVSAQEARQLAAMETLRTDTLIEEARVANRAEHERDVLLAMAKTRAHTLSARHREELEAVGGVDGLMGGVEASRLSRALFSAAKEHGVGTPDPERVYSKDEHRALKLDRYDLELDIEEAGVEIRDRTGIAGRLGLEALLDVTEVVRDEQDERKTLVDVADHYGRKLGNAPSTNNTARRVARYWEEAFGPIAVEDIKPNHFRRFSEMLGRMPIDKGATIASVPLPEKIKRADADNLKRVSESTVATMLKYVTKMTAYAAKNGFADNGDPLATISVSRPKRPIGARTENYEPFTRAELDRVAEAWCLKFDKHHDYHWLFWLLLYSGARRTEIAQLRISDVNLVAMTLKFDPEEEWMRVKNKPSIRTIPIHPELLKMGFAEFVERRLRAQDDPQGYGRLFPSFVVGDGRKAGTAASSAFTVTGRSTPP